MRLIFAARIATQTRDFKDVSVSRGMSSTQLAVYSIYTFSWGS